VVTILRFQNLVVYCRTSSLILYLTGLFLVSPGRTPLLATFSWLNISTDRPPRSFKDGIKSLSLTPGSTTLPKKDVIFKILSPLIRSSSHSTLPPASLYMPITYAQPRASGNTFRRDRCANARRFKYAFRTYTIKLEMPRTHTALSQWCTCARTFNKNTSLTTTWFFKMLLRIALTTPHFIILEPSEPGTSTTLQIENVILPLSRHLPAFMLVPVGYTRHWV
jgi:hypothetical protein